MAAGAGVGLLLLAGACFGLGSAKACTEVGPPFGLTFVQMRALNEPPLAPDDPLVVDYCADDVCRGAYVRSFSTDPAITGGEEVGDAFMFDFYMGSHSYRAPAPARRGRSGGAGGERAGGGSGGQLRHQRTGLHR